MLSLSWQCTAKSVIYFNFKYNQKELALTVCENKDKPDSCCKAKCYLDKEIKKEEKKQSDLPSSLKDKTEKSELFSGFIIFSALQYSILQAPAFTYVSILPEQSTKPVFHPPTV